MQQTSLILGHRSHTCPMSHLYPQAGDELAEAAGRAEIGGPFHPLGATNARFRVDTNCEECDIVSRSLASHSAHLQRLFRDAKETVLIRWSTA